MAKDLISAHYTSLLSSISAFQTFWTQRVQNLFCLRGLTIERFFVRKMIPCSRGERIDFSQPLSDCCITC